MWQGKVYRFKTAKKNTDEKKSGDHGKRALAFKNKGVVRLRSDDHP